LGRVVRCDVKSRLQKKSGVGILGEFDWVRGVAVGKYSDVGVPGLVVRLFGGVGGGCAATG